MIEKSSNFTFSVTHLARSPASRRARATAPPIRRACRRSSARAVHETAKVSSWPMDFAPWPGSTGRSSIPFASSVSRSALARPMCPASRSGSIVASSSTEVIPSRSSFAAVAGPTPQISRRRSDARTAASSSGIVTTTPRPSVIPCRVAVGLARRLASFAKSLRLATPTQHETESSSRTRSRIPHAISKGLPSSATEPVTSRNASSSPSDSTSGVAVPRIWWNDEETSS